VAFLKSRSSSPGKYNPNDPGEYKKDGNNLGLGEVERGLGIEPDKLNQEPRYSVEY
jgi:hypothetical protein